MSKITRAEALNLISQAISLAGDGGCTPFTDEEYKAMYDLLEEIKKESKPKKSSPKRSADDWKGCQGYCDFEPQPNITGWI